MNADTLESMCELIVDCPHSTPKWTNDGIIVLTNKNIKNGVLDLSSPSFTNEEDYQKRIKRAVPQAGDIVFTREAPMGEVCIIPSGLKCCLGQRQVLLRPENHVCGAYLFWALQSPFVKHQISWNEGTGSTVSNVRIPVLKALNIPRHIGNEGTIAKVLSDLANKIELNRQTNQTLEHIAQAIFKSWFVDFDPTRAKIAAKQNGQDPEHAAMAAISGKTLDELDQLSSEQLEQLKITAALFPDELVESEHGEAPKGWQLGELRNIADFSTDRMAVSELTLETYISTENMLEGKKGISLASSLPSLKTVPRFLPKQILISNIRPYFMKIWLARFDGGRSNDVLGIKAKEVESVEYLYNLLYQDEFFNFMMTTSKGAKMPRGDKDAIMSWVCVQPSIKIKKAYSAAVGSFYETIDSANKENEVLSALRDSLLPKLLSGEIKTSANNCEAQ